MFSNNFIFFIQLHQYHQLLVMYFLFIHC